MTAPRLVGRALYFLPLLLGTAAVLAQPSRTAPAGAVFIVLVLYAHGGARVLGAKGGEKGLLFLETLPFFGLGAVALGRLEAPQALLVAGAGAVAAAALLAGERLLGLANFATSLGFIGATGLLGAGLAVLPPEGFLGLALLALTLAGYGLARRRRG